MSRSALVKSGSQKQYSNIQRLGYDDVTLVAEHLPTKCRAISIHRTKKPKQTKRTTKQKWRNSKSILKKFNVNSNRKP
jgi:hypothetical protein